MSYILWTNRANACIRVNDNGSLTLLINWGIKVLDETIWEGYGPSQNFRRLGLERKLDVFIPESVNEINSGVLNIPIFVKRIEELRLPDSVRRIGVDALSGLYELKDIILSKSLICIADDAFRNCRSLQRVEILESVRKLGCHIFEGCESLKEINVPEHLLIEYGEEYIKSGTKAKVTTLVPHGAEITKQEVPNVVEEHELNLETEVDSRNPKYGGKKCNVKTSEQKLTIPKKSYSGVVRPNLLHKRK